MSAFAPYANAGGIWENGKFRDITPEEQLGLWRMKADWAGARSAECVAAKMPPKEMPVAQRISYESALHDAHLALDSAKDALGDEGYAQQCDALRGIVDAAASAIALFKTAGFVEQQAV